MLFSRLKIKLWIGLLFTSLHLWVRLTASTSQPSSPNPTLDLLSRSTDTAVLVCRAPGGLKGVHFVLYRVKEKVDSRDLPLGAEEVHFTVRLSGSSQHELYCCLYKTKEGIYSTFSPYFQLNLQRDADPSRPVPPKPDPPVLSVEPSNGLVKRGDKLSFHCSLPPPLPQYQVNSYNGPVSFMLLRGAAKEGATAVVPQPQSSPLLSSEPQPGVFSVGPVTGAEQGQYSCLYRINRGRQLLNSTVSNMVQVTVTDLLPTPTLALQQESDIWHLLCSGSPSYPGAMFSLYVADTALPVASYQARVTQHQAVFSVPVQDTAVALYQCEYSVRLGREWSRSERSPSLPVSQDSGYAPRDSAGVDLPLIVGSLSAVVLFLCAAALLIVVLHRKVKAAAEAKKEREGAQFWTQVHGKDHVVDLTLRRSSFTSQDWTNSHRESASRSNLWNPLSTFTTPIVPNY